MVDIRLEVRGTGRCLWVSLADGPAGAGAVSVAQALRAASATRGHGTGSGGGISARAPVATREHDTPFGPHAPATKTSACRGTATGTFTGDMSGITEGVAALPSSRLRLVRRDVWRAPGRRWRLPWVMTARIASFLDVPGMIALDAVCAATRRQLVQGAVWTDRVGRDPELRRLRPARWRRRAICSTDAGSDGSGERSGGGATEYSDFHAEHSDGAAAYSDGDAEYSDGDEDFAGAHVPLFNGGDGVDASAATSSQQRPVVDIDLTSGAVARRRRRATSSRSARAAATTTDGTGTTRRQAAARRLCRRFVGCMRRARGLHARLQHETRYRGWLRPALPVAARLAAVQRAEKVVGAPMPLLLYCLYACFDGQYSRVPASASLAGWHGGLLPLHAVGPPLDDTVRAFADAPLWRITDRAGFSSLAVHSGTGRVVAVSALSTLAVADDVVHLVTKCATR